MSNPNRDDQFAGWAKAVLNELVHTPNIDIDPLYDFKLEGWQHILARAGYDLVTHTLEYVFAHPDIDDCLAHPTDEPIALIPDLAELPEEQAE